MQKQLIESAHLHETTRSSQLDVDAELLDLRKKIVEYEKEMKRLKMENEELKTTTISDDELEKWKAIEAKMKGELEQSHIDLEDALRQLAVERRAREEAEVYM
jgi:regulator of replication initiation timing